MTVLPTTIPTTIPTVEILGIPVHCVDFATTLEQVEAWIDTPAHVDSAAAEDASSRGCRQICTVNPEFLVDAAHDPLFADVLQQADLLVPDGIGILWAARLHGVRLHERVTGSDGIYRFCARAAEKGWRVFFLGAGPGVAARTAALLRQRYPNLQVAGTYSGDPSPETWPEIRQRLMQTRPDLLFVAFGHPRQDFWIAAHRPELPVQVAIGVGGAFDFVAGVTTRAPRWIQRMGLEWLYRLVQEPWRWRRMSKLPRFAARVLWSAYTQKQAHRSS